MILSTWQRAATAAALVAAGVLVGTNISTTNRALGEVTAMPEPPTFQAGSVPILKDISATLHQMDAALGTFGNRGAKAKDGSRSQSGAARNDGGC